MKKILERITVDPEICQGLPCIRGQRITVAFILKLLASGKTPQQIIADYPELEIEDIYEAIRYAAWLANERTFN
jgi:uncharacterized protein (DUF433 family)